MVRVGGFNHFAEGESASACFISVDQNKVVTSSEINPSTRARVAALRMKSSQIHALSESELKLSPPLLREGVNLHLMPADARLFAAIGESKRETIGGDAGSLTFDIV